MKKLVLLFVLFIGISASAQNAMYIDSVKVLPLNPTALDSVWLHVYWWSPYGTSLTSANVLHTGNTHNADICYTVGMITVVMQEQDSFFLFQGPQGMHTVTWSITQNSPNGQCDAGLTQGATQVNVIATGIEEQASLHRMEWFPGTQSIRCNEGGQLSVYSTSGQLISVSTVRRDEILTLKTEAGQMYFATLVTSDGKSSTLKFVGE